MSPYDLDPQCNIRRRRRFHRWLRRHRDTCPLRRQPPRIQRIDTPRLKHRRRDRTRTSPTRQLATTASTPLRPKTQSTIGPARDHHISHNRCTARLARPSPPTSVRAMLRPRAECSIPRTCLGTGHLGSRAQARAKGFCEVSHAGDLCIIATWSIFYGFYVEI
jgi:hypothetical protein